MVHELLPILDRLRGLPVLVIGEAMLDSYLEGPTGRLCREAPVPVVTVTRRTDVPGGAANAAVNAASLGASVDFLSVVGDDAEGALLSAALRARGVGNDHLLVQRGRRTLAKHRVLAGGQMVVRYDEGDTAAVGPAVERRLIARLRALLPRAGAVVVSDYAYGVLTPAVVAALREIHAAHDRVLVVDARHLPAYRDVAPTVVKPNYEEVADLLGLDDAVAFARAAAVAAEGERVLDLTGARIAAVTLDRDGALLLESGRVPHPVAAKNVRNAHVAGAGDTFCVAFGLALAAGATSLQAGDLAAAAAAVVVAKDGTAACSAAELREHLTSDGKYIRDAVLLAARLDVSRQQGRRIVFTNGCFDILHAGHISYLNRARGVDDILVVGLNSDASVTRLKGPGRPINSLDDRARVLAALSCVDNVVPFEEDTPRRLIRLVRPDLYVKGGDYDETTLPEASLVRSLGGQVAILPFVEDRSTTSIIERIQQNPPHRARADERNPRGARPGLGKR